MRAVRGEDGVTVVELAGLGRSESLKVADELGTVVDGLLPTAPVAPESPIEGPIEGPSEEPSAETQPEDEGARA